MAIKLSEALTKVRLKTRHDVDVRVTDAYIADGLSDGARKLRGWLSVDVPTLYLKPSDVIDVAQDPPEISLVSTEYNFENIYRVDRLWEDVGWRALKRADELTPNTSIHGQLSFRLEHLCLIIGPDWHEDIAGQYRIVFHPRPVPLTAPADLANYFQIPDALDLALAYLGCIAVAERDNEKAEWDKKAKAEYDDALPALRARHGVHASDSGLRRVMGY